MSADDLWAEALGMAMARLERPHLEITAIKMFAQIEPKFIRLLESIDQDLTVSDLLKVIRS